MFRRLLWLLLLPLTACQFGAVTPTPSALLPSRIINFWEPTSASLASADEIQPWQFVAQAGDNIRVRAIAPNPVKLTLQNAAGVTVTQAASQLEASLSEAGIYTILVQATSAGAYEIGLSYSDRPNPSEPTPTLLPVTVAVPTPTPPYYARLGTLIGVLTSGQPVGGEFAAPEERHVYSFEGVSGQYLSIQSDRVTGSVDPVISLYAPSGDEVATDDNSGGFQSALLRNIGLTQDGQYILQVWGHGLSGRYQVSLTSSAQTIPITPTIVLRIPPTPVAEILTPTVAAALSGQNLYDHVPVTGAIERAGDFDRYPIQLASGQAVTVAVSPAQRSGLRPRIELYDTSGALVASVGAADSNADGDALLPAFLAAETGTYTIFVLGDTSTIGAYTVSYGEGYSHQDVRHGLTAPDQTYSGEVARRGLRDEWSLDLNQDDVITVTAGTLTPGFDPFLELTAPDGSLVAMDDNGGGGVNSQIVSARAPVSGRYHLRVSSVNAAGKGTYTLVWRYINLAPTATPPPASLLLLSYADAIPDQAYKFYRFYGRAGMHVLIRVVASEGSKLDPVAALLGQDGAVIAEGDDDDGLNPRFTADLTADGTYTVRVNGYLTSGEFELFVEAQY